MPVPWSTPLTHIDWCRDAQLHSSSGGGREGWLTRTIVWPWTLAENASKAARSERSNIIAAGGSVGLLRSSGICIDVGCPLLLIPYSKEHAYRLQHGEPDTAP